MYLARDCPTLVNVRNSSNVAVLMFIFYFSMYKSFFFFFLNTKQQSIYFSNMNTSENKFYEVIIKDVQLCMKVKSKQISIILNYVQNL